MQRAENIAAFVFMFVWLFIPIKHLLKDKKHLLRWVKYIIFTVYVLGNLSQTIFFREPSSEMVNSFLPFEMYYKAIQQVIYYQAEYKNINWSIRWRNIWFLWELVLNMLLYVPLGYLLPFLWDGLRTRRNVGKHSRWARKRGTNRYVPMVSGKIVGIGVLCTLATELTQMIFHIGAFQVDDLINNTLGCVIGCVLYEWVMRFDERRRIR